MHEPGEGQRSPCPPGSRFGLYLRMVLDRFQGTPDLLFRQVVDLQFSGQESVICGKINNAVTAEIEKDHLLPAFLFCPLGLVHDSGDCMVCLGCRDEPLGSCPFDTGIESFQLIVSPRIDKSFLVQMAHDRSHPMISKASGMDRFRHKIVSESKHCQQRGCPCQISEVVRVRASCRVGQELGSAAITFTSLP